MTPSSASRGRLAATECQMRWAAGPVGPLRGVVARRGHGGRASGQDVSPPRPVPSGYDRGGGHGGLRPPRPRLGGSAAGPLPPSSAGERRPGGSSTAGTLPDEVLLRAVIHALAKQKAPSGYLSSQVVHGGIRKGCFITAPEPGLRKFSELRPNSGRPNLAGRDRPKLGRLHLKSAQSAQELAKPKPVENTPMLVEWGPSLVEVSISPLEFAAMLTEVRIDQAMPVYLCMTCTCRHRLGHTIQHDDICTHRRKTLATVASTSTWCTQ